ncbi:transglycosylase domain-containing protein [Streptomyces sp. NPDC006879]|uniref:transglycosylase domain-containing protein n=1 Tax=Streptomyces sp. NPDC006879 TaxID=3364767 RepID=UPI00368EE758
MSDPSPRPRWAPRDPDGVPSGPAPAAGPRGRRPARRRRLLGGLLLCTALPVGGFAAGYLLVDIPPANAAALAQSNEYFYADGTLLARDGKVDRQNVRLGQVPEPVREAVLAAEDRDFYRAQAVDPKAMLRASWNTLRGRGRQSGSTITQQYVKNHYLAQEQTISRKVKEFFISIKLGREESKDSILQGYLNTSYFGRNAYGIQAAAQAYYGKDVERLSTAEGAYLAALLNSPSSLDVVSHPQNRARALARWNYVLDGMVSKKWLAAEDRAGFVFPEPGQVRPRSGLSGQRGYLVEAVRNHLTERKIVDERTLAAGGYRITTTIDKKRQDDFVEAVREQLTGFLSITRPKDRLVRVGGASIDPASGKVVALYGGVDFTQQYVNNSTRRDYQIGSAFKPFVFAAAVENRSRTQDGEVITPHTRYNGDNGRPVTGSPISYSPGNEDEVSYGDITVQQATDQSVNAVYAQMAVDVGPARVKKTAIDLGLPADAPAFQPVPAIALGVVQASVLDLTQAYATLAAHGRHTPHTLVENVSRNGADLTLPERAPRQAVSREAADTTTAMLTGVVENGTGAAAQKTGRPTAGKTGTAELDRAAWFAGYTPELATVVAVMGQDPDTGTQQSLYGALGLQRLGGAGFPARIWTAYTRAALTGTPHREFDLRLQPGSQSPLTPPFPRRRGTDQPGGTWREHDPNRFTRRERPLPAGPTGSGRAPDLNTTGTARPNGPDGSSAPDISPHDGEAAGPRSPQEQPGDSTAFPEQRPDGPPAPEVRNSVSEPEPSPPQTDGD